MSTPLPRAETALLGTDQSGPTVTAIGGGAGLATTLEAVQTYAGQMSAVVTVADDGGSSGRLTAGMNIPPPGDLRKCLLALAPEPTMWSELFAHRFDRSDVAGHSLGNLMIAALAEITGDLSSALRITEDLLHCRGSVYPAALEPARLRGLIDGAPVSGQVAMARTPGEISEIQIEPDELVANPAAVHAIRDADQIVLSCGSLFTSLVAAMLVPGIARAINEARGSLVLVLNLVTQREETLGFDGRDHVAALAAFGGVTRPGTIVAHTGPLDVPDGLSPVSIGPEGFAGWTVVRGDVAEQGAEWPRHDPLALGRMLGRIAGE